MGLINKFKNFVGVEDELDEVYEYEDYEPERPVRQSRVVEDDFIRSRVRERENVIPMPKTHTGGHVKMIVVTEIKSLDECQRLVEGLKARKSVIVNLEKIETQIANKIFNFLQGAICALGGTVEKIANNIFVFAPDNVDISTNSTENKGFGFARDDSPWKG